MDTDARFINAHRHLRNHLNRDCDRDTCLQFANWLDQQNGQGIYPTAKQTYEWACVHAPHALAQTGTPEQQGKQPQQPSDYSDPLLQKPSGELRRQACQHCPMPQTCANLKDCAEALRDDQWWASYVKIEFTESRPAVAFDLATGPDEAVFQTLTLRGALFPGEAEMLQEELDDLITSAEARAGETLEMVESCRKRVGREDGGRELALAKTKLQEVRYWLSEARKVAGQK